MGHWINRREFLKLFGLGSMVFVTGVGKQSFGAGKPLAQGGFYFVQLSDTHIGFNDPTVNPDFVGTLKKAVAMVNDLEHQPDFIIFTGDLSHTTDDPKERRARMNEFKGIIDQLKVRNIKFMPGEHDAGLDRGEAFQELFGKTHYAFEHKGAHFIAIDNVSDPTSSIGDDQLQWFGGELKKLRKTDRIVVFTHRPLFSLYPQWDWWTRDGQKAIDLLQPYKNVVVFYGHIHQEHHSMSGHIPFHAAKGMMFPLPAPGSQPKRAPVPWDPAMPYKGIGFREVEAKTVKADYTIVEYPIAAQKGSAGQVIKITAKKFEYNPREITLKKGVPVTLELTSLDRLHGFNCPDLGIRGDINPGAVTRISFTPQKTGNFTFFCDNFCGEGHEGMNGTFKVVE